MHATLLTDPSAYRYTEAQETLDQAKVLCRAHHRCKRRVARLTLVQEREIRIVGELKQSKEQHKRDTAKLSSERDALEDAGAACSSRTCVMSFGG